MSITAVIVVTAEMLLAHRPGCRARILQRMLGNARLIVLHQGLALLITQLLPMAVAQRALQ